MAVLTANVIARYVWRPAASIGLDVPQQLFPCFIMAGWFEACARAATSRGMAVCKLGREGSVQYCFRARLGALAYIILCHQGLVVANNRCHRAQPGIGFPCSYGYWPVLPVPLIASAR